MYSTFIHSLHQISSEVLCLYWGDSHAVKWYVSKLLHSPLIYWSVGPISGISKAVQETQHSTLGLGVKVGEIGDYSPSITIVKSFLLILNNKVHINSKQYLWVFSNYLYALLHVYYCCIIRFFFQL